MSCSTTIFEVFFVKADLTSGTYTVERDFGVAEQVDFTVQVDVEELADTSYQCNVYTREDETDAWQLMGGTGSNAVDTRATLSFVRSRHVKVEVTTTGTPEFESGVTGYTP